MQRCREAAEVLGNREDIYASLVHTALQMVHFIYFEGIDHNSSVTAKFRFPFSGLFFAF